MSMREKFPTRTIRLVGHAQLATATALLSRVPLNSDKECTKCGVRKLKSEFSRNKNNPDGLQFHCKECCCKARAEYTLKNPNKCRENHSDYYKKHGDSIKEKKRANYAKNKEKHQEKRRDYYAKNRAKCLESSKKYAALNAETVKGRLREWRLRNADWIKQYSLDYARKNIDAMRVRWAIRRARKKGAKGSHSLADIKSFLYLQRERCACCKNKLNGKFHIDHIVPLARGGSNDKANIQILCPRCNLSKRAKDPIDFMQSRGYLL